MNMSLVLLAISSLVCHISAAGKYMAVNQSNCRNGVNLFHSCAFIIDIEGFINETIHCKLYFNSSNATVEFSNQILSIISETKQKCPIWQFHFYTSPRNYKLAVTCGGEIEPINKTIELFIGAELNYDPKGLIDRETRTKMSLTLTNPDPNVSTDPVETFAINAAGSPNQMKYIAPIWNRTTTLIVIIGTSIILFLFVAVGIIVIIKCLIPKHIKRMDTEGVSSSMAEKLFQNPKKSLSVADRNGHQYEQILPDI